MCVFRERDFKRERRESKIEFPIFIHVKYFSTTRAGTARVKKKKRRRERGENMRVRVFFFVVFFLCASCCHGKEDNNNKNKRAFSIGFPTVSDAEHQSNENKLERTLTKNPSRKTLNIALVTCEFDGPTNNGGIGTQFTALAKLYAKNGHRVTVVFTEGER